jgi:hypothetical protein
MGILEQESTLLQTQGHRRLERLIRRSHAEELGLESTTVRKDLVHSGTPVIQYCLNIWMLHMSHGVAE